MKDKIRIISSYNVFMITPGLSVISERMYNGKLAYCYLNLSWGYWGIELTIIEEKND